MKKILLLISVIYAPTLCFGQKEKAEHFVTLTLSNNGEVSDVIEDFYFNAQLSGYAPSDDVFEYKQTGVKYNFYYEYKNKNNLAFCGKIGYCKRKDTFRISNITPATGTKEQDYLSFAVDFKYVYQADRLQFSAGIEIPYYMMSTYTEKVLWDAPAQTIHSTATIDNGHAYGVNSVYSGRFFVTKRFFLATDFTFGLLSFKLGKHFTYKLDVQEPIVFPDGQYQIDDSYKITIVSKPEFYFGFGVKL